MPRFTIPAQVLTYEGGERKIEAGEPTAMPPIPWPSLQSFILATVLALVAFMLWELLGADIAYAPL